MTDEFGVLLKVRAADDRPPPDDERLGRVLAAMPGDDKKLTGGGRDFTVSFWVRAADASAAVEEASRSLRTAARDLGLPTLQVIRSHAASVEGRVSAYHGVGSRLSQPDQWSVYFKVAAPHGTAPVDAVLLNRFLEAFGSPDATATLHGDKEKFLLSDGRGFTVRFWASGTTPEDAIVHGRERLRATLERLDLGDWPIVRVQAAAPSARHHDTFPGADRRRMRPTEETR